MLKVHLKSCQDFFCSFVKCLLTFILRKRSFSLRNENYTRTTHFGTARKKNQFPQVKVLLFPWKKNKKKKIKKTP